MARLDGSEERLIASGFMFLPRMSPDARRIAYVALRHRRSSDCMGCLEPAGTQLIDARTGMPIRRLWRGRALSIDWSPDGERLALAGELEKREPPGGRVGYRQRRDRSA